MLIHKAGRGESFTIHEDPPQKVVVVDVTFAKVRLMINGQMQDFGRFHHKRFTTGFMQIHAFEQFNESEPRCAFALDFPRHINIER